MFTMRWTARSCPTIFANSRRSKSSTAGLRISGSRSTSSETNGLTIALHLLPVFPSLCQESLESASTLSPASRLPIKFRLLESLTAVPYIRWEWLFLYAVIASAWRTLAGALSGLDGAAIQIFILQNDLACTKFSSGTFSSGLTDFFPNTEFLQNQEATICHGLGISDVVEKPVDPVSDHFRNTADATSNDRNLTRHRFECDEAERFQVTLKQKDIRNGKKLAHVILFPNKDHVVRHSVCTGKPLRLRAIWAIADHQQS